MAANVRQRTGLQHQPLITQILRQIGHAGRFQDLQRTLGLSIEKVDNRKARCDLSAGSALQAMLNLMLQQLSGLIQQVDRYQPIRESPDHFITAPADRRQFAKIVKEAERLDRRKRVALPAEKKNVERRCGIILDPACNLRSPDAPVPRYA